jgi:hypothetical protein
MGALVFPSLSPISRPILQFCNFAKTFFIPFIPRSKVFPAAIQKGEAGKSFHRIKIVSRETCLRLNEFLFDNLPDMYENASAKGKPSFALKNSCGYPSED